MMPRRLDEIDAVVVVLLDAGGDRENIRIEDDVFRREADLVHQNVVGALADLDLALEGVGLALLVEGHHHDRGAVAAHPPRVIGGIPLAFLERDRIDHALALEAPEAGLDHAPLRRIHHHRHARDVGLGGDQVEKLRHRLGGVEQALVHVDVDDLRAVLDLVARDRQRRGVVARGDQLAELGRAGDVGAFADVDEREFRGERERLEPGERRNGRSPDRARGLAARRPPRWRMCSGVVPQQPPTMLIRPAAANSPSRVAISSGRLVIGTPNSFGGGRRSGRPRPARRSPRQARRRWARICSGPRAQFSPRETGVRRAGPRSSSASASGRTACGRAVGDGAGDHDRHAYAGRRTHLDGEERGLGVERVEDGLDQQQVGAAVEQPAHLLAVGVAQLVEGDGAEARVGDVGRDRRGAVGRPERAGDKARPAVLAAALFAASRASRAPSQLSS